MSVETESLENLDELDKPSIVGEALGYQLK